MAAPENNAAKAKKKRSTINKKINDSLAKQQKLIDVATQKVGQLTTDLNAMSYHPQQNHDEILALNEALARAYDSLGYEHLAQRCKLEDLLETHAGAITPEKVMNCRHESWEAISSSNVAVAASLHKNRWAPCWRRKKKKTAKNYSPFCKA